MSKPPNVEHSSFKLLSGLKKSVYMFLQVYSKHFLLSREQDEPRGFSCSRSLSEPVYRPRHLRPEPGRRRESASQNPSGVKSIRGKLDVSDGVCGNHYSFKVQSWWRLGEVGGNTLHAFGSHSVADMFLCFIIDEQTTPDVQTPQAVPPTCSCPRSVNTSPPPRNVYFITHKFILHFYSCFI